MLAGNDNWRSPEGHFKGELNKPADLYSFGLVVRVQTEPKQRRSTADMHDECVYAVLGRVVLGHDDDFQLHEANGALPQLIRLQRQVSYFGDKEGMSGLMKHVGDEEINCRLLDMLWEERNADYIPYVPFAEWADVDSSFKDLVLGLTSLDPLKRATARQALEHPWFECVEIV
jgi:serine/threonine protein kinase